MPTSSCWEQSHAAEIHRAVWREPCGNLRGEITSTPPPIPSTYPVHFQLLDELPQQDTNPQALQHGEGMLLSQEMHMTYATHRAYSWFPSCTLCHQLPPSPHRWLGNPGRVQGCQTLPPVPSTLSLTFHAVWGDTRCLCGAKGAEEALG